MREAFVAFSQGLPRLPDLLVSQLRLTRVPPPGAGGCQGVGSLRRVSRHTQTKPTIAPTMPQTNESV